MKGRILLLVSFVALAAIQLVGTMGCSKNSNSPQGPNDVGAIRTFVLTIANPQSVTLAVNPPINCPPYQFPAAVPQSIGTGSSVDISLGYLPASISMSATETPLPALPQLPVQIGLRTMYLGVDYQATDQKVTFQLQ
jgi:hypothetical protein